MFGAGLNATELAELIERDLQLHVAFPCFPLDSSLGHTACSVVQKSWLDQLHNGTATSLYESKATPSKEGVNGSNINGTSSGNGSASSNGTATTGVGEVNVFINVISKTKPLQQDNWTRVRVFAESAEEKSVGLSRPQQKSLPTLTSISSNKDWNITAEDYIRELMITDDSGSFKSDEARRVAPAYPNYKDFFEQVERAGMTSGLATSV
ncbi:hypothetical protein K457DRAFT_394508 [Linnemannia elongata AG-77]|uniref:Uncharacterized protein n=1 Tax=Linnemannia elongata AG-77 TaxID=1314771 RepID=A0A197K4G0_9FUNG|nr:hypothetical protein K457DRAFT_394508 [Linnemannia elongata AG-77]